MSSSPAPDLSPGGGSTPDQRLRARLRHLLADFDAVVTAPGAAPLGLYLLRRTGELERIDDELPAHGARGPRYLALADVLATLDGANRVGDLRFVPASDLTATPLRPLARVLPDDGGLVLAPLRLDDDEVVGYALVRLATRPERASRPLLERFEHDLRQLGPPLHAVVLAREVLEHDRLTRSVRAIGHRMADLQDGDVGYEAALTAIAKELDVDDVWLEERHDGTTHHRAVSAGTKPFGDIRESVTGAVARLAERAWARDGVQLVARHRYVPGLRDERDERDVALLLGRVDQSRYRSMVVVPLGAGSECVGSLTLARRPERRGWSDIELERLVDLGHDLGRAVVNRRSLQRERRAKEQLAELDRHRREFVAAVSHELRTPLSVVMGHLELLHEVEGEGLQRSLAAALRGTDRLAALIDELLVLTRLQQVDHHVDDLDVRAVVTETLHELAPVAEAASIGLRLEAPPGPVPLRASRPELERLVLNLVGNAIKYGHGGGVVDVRVDTDVAHVRLTVTDDGIGIAPDDLERVFDDFVRGSTEDARRRPGSGLGLAIVRRVAERHGGTVVVRSELDVGSTFEVTFPR